MSWAESTALRKLLPEQEIPAQAGRTQAPEQEIPPLQSRSIWIRCPAVIKGGGVT